MSRKQMLVVGLVATSLAADGVSGVCQIIC